MIAVCLTSATASAVVLASTFVLAWTHSIEKVRWEELWRVDGTELVLDEVRVRGHGAGMEPPAQAQLRDGVWHWQPASRHAVLRLTRSPFAPDYDWCFADAACIGLGAILPADGGITEVRACAADAGSLSDETENASHAKR